MVFFPLLFSYLFSLLYVSVKLKFHIQCWILLAKFHVAYLSIYLYKIFVYLQILWSLELMNLQSKRKECQSCCKKTLSKYLTCKRRGFFFFLPWIDNRTRNCNFHVHSQHLTICQFTICYNMFYQIYGKPSVDAVLRCLHY